MGFRFSKSIRLGKGIRLNISKSGFGVSGGVKGFRVGVGPRGTRMTASVPGTGISYSKQFSGKSHYRVPKSAPMQTTNYTLPSTPIPQPSVSGFFAPLHEKQFVQGFKDYQEGRIDAALQNFLAVAPKDACGALCAATILVKKPGGEAPAIAWLERIVQSDVHFPTPLMQKYLTTSGLQISITPQVVVTVPMDGMAATLMLVELYQAQGRMNEAIGLLEELEELSNNPILTLSLCDLYAQHGVWDGIIARAKNTKSEDDITLETVIFYGQAMYEKGLYDAAVTVFTDALRRKKNRKPVLLNEAIYWRALSYEKLGKINQSNKEFQKLYAQAPDFKDVAHRAGAIVVNNKQNLLTSSSQPSRTDITQSTCSSTERRCMSCGKVTEGSVKFCGYCGTLLPTHNKS